MHELAVTKSILSIVLHEASKADAKKVLAIKLTIGALSSFEEDCISMYYEELSKDTIAAGAKLIVTKVAAQLYCKNCDYYYTLEHADYNCPKCGLAGVYQGDGQDFLVQSIEIE
jgi:hydrogenase nickel incorporation protein HypA/HybF